MDSAGYVVSRLHKINKRAAQRMAGAMPPQHCVGKGSCLYPCARARKSNPAVPCLKQSALMGHSIYLLSSTSCSDHVSWLGARGKQDLVCKESGCTRLLSACRMRCRNTSKSSVWLCPVAETKIWGEVLERRKKSSLWEMNEASLVPKQF